MIVAGIMSGTSLDGITVAAVDVRGRNWTLLEHVTVAYPRRLRERLLAISNAEAHTGEIAYLHFALGEEYARALGRLESAYVLVGCHGQTVFHGKGCTLQLGEAQVIAERVQRPVVSNFRPRDIAAGGQGAPLVPFVDYRLFQHRRRTRVLLNIGGIANVTLLRAGGSADDVIAFDTGPGNMVIDQLAWVITKGKQTFDRGGRLAKQGKPNRTLLAQLLRDPYYRGRPPKSCGREQFGREFVASLLATQLPLPDLIATASLLTPLTISDAVREYAPDELIASGGGTMNPVIMDHLRGLLPGVLVSTTDDHGLPAEAKEAVAFAILAYETWHRRWSNLPSATGARRAVILGSITHA
jgi:anhydro-N-acetylmuramic acid kinase